MNCIECSMRYVCDTLIGGKDKCVYGLYIPIIGSTSNNTENEEEKEDDDA